MSKKRQPPLFYRSMYLTLGGFSMILSGFLWINDGKNSSTWPFYAWILLVSLFGAGVFFFLFGLLASDKKIESTRIVATPANLILAVLATPLYLVLKGIHRKKNESTLHKKRGRLN